MKEMVKRLFALFFAMTLVCAMAPVSALAADSDAAPTVCTDDQVYINPLYRDIVTEEDLNEPSDVMLLADTEYHTSVQSAGEVLREGMVARAGTILVGYTGSTWDFETRTDENGDAVNVYTGDAYKQISEAAMTHTGVPTEGDYLRWQFAGYKVRISGRSSENGSYHYTFEYTVTYYTTYEQEETVTSAVNTLLDDLEVGSMTTNYAKIKAVYDWICDHVTYDHVHLSDTSYKIQYTAYGALIDGTSVCQGYALLLYRCALEMGIDCRFIGGTGVTSTGSGAHGWNIVKMDDNLYYNADATWDINYAANDNYAYFLKCEANFTDHIRGTSENGMDYTTEAFHAAYPMGQRDYDPYSGICGENLTWTLDENYVLTITGSGAMYDFTKDTQPWEAYTQKITAVEISDGATSVGEYAFFHCYDLASVTLPDSITSIGMNAFFYCNSLQSIDLPENLQTIGNYAFGSCTALAEADLPESLVTIGDKVFSGCEITSALIPEGVTSIGVQAFLGCPLTKVTIPASLTSIGSCAFQDCAPLNFITVDSANTAYCNDDQGAMYSEDGTVLIVVPAGFAGEFKIPDSVTEITHDALRNCDELTGVVIPESVAAIGEAAFYDCAKLDNVVLPTSVTMIPKHTFGYCLSLSHITIPANITEIGAGAFSGCSSLRSITFQGDAPALGDYMFSDVTATAYYPAGNATWTEEIMADYGGDITWQPELFELYGTSMVLGSSLTISFGIDGANLEGENNYAVITKTYADGREDAVVRVDQADWENVGGHVYACSFTGVAAKEMCDDVTIIICNAEDAQVSETYTDSIRDYALRIYGKEGTGDELKSVLVDMLNYGAAAQVQFGYDTGNLANADLNEEQQQYATSSVETKNIREMGAGYEGTALTLEHEILMDFLYTDDVIGSASYAEATYTDHYGHEKKMTYQAEEFQAIEDGKTFVSVSGMAVADCGQAVTLTLYGADGTVLSKTVDSPESYIHRMANGGDIYMAIMKFATSAYNYFH